MLSVVSFDALAFHEIERGAHFPSTPFVMLTIETVLQNAVNSVL